MIGYKAKTVFDLCRAMALVMILGGAAAHAANAESEPDGELAVERVPLPSSAKDVLLLADGAFLLTDDGYLRLAPCEATAVCAEPVGGVELPRPTPGGGMPDGTIAERDGGDLTEAWYAGPTRRYDHGILGDEFEASALIARSSEGETFRAELPSDSVFEDLTPRLVDLDGDGRTEIVTIISDGDAGSRLSVWGLVGDSLAERAASAPAGQARRWLNPLPVEDDNSIMSVMTPHLGGPLLEWQFEDGELSEPRQLGGDIAFSNHAIGSRDQSLAVREGEKWAVPEKGLKVLILGDGPAVTHRLPLDFTIGDDIALVGNAIVMRSVEGELYAVRRP
ncbi:hypothetical protein [Notoacmeibacter ruber]|uniref:VCBS repeat-containing protein n=1 Tax=Notoacmeibacter ruber TaxID=2670375 RepID=A0A3L7JAI1_9HYPH|nr:hypothetical protein [Notoacmeibacter ruber]RLQ87444.1 hypothetical protein D8780_03710 [Notoacmeibacter ruber]